MSYYFKSNENLQETSFFVFLILNAVVFPFSEALISISSGLLLFQVIIFRSWKHPSVKARSLKTLFFPLSVFFVYIIGTAFTNNFGLSLYELKKNIFWLIIPLAIFFSPKLPAKKVFTVFALFVLAVIISSFIITGRLIFNDSTQLSEFRQLSIISHIRFSLQVGLTMIILIWSLIQKNSIAIKINTTLIFFLLVWLTLFLFMLKSLVGILAGAGTAVVALIYYAWNLKKTKFKLPVTVFLVAVILFPVVYTGKVLHDFYDFKPIDPESVDDISLAGNPYHHDFSQHMRENGHLVYVYINENELRNEWNKRSSVKYDDDLNGFPLGSTLIRYLASRGYRKDSVGVNKLTVEDIEMIERGATNYKFKNHILSLYPRIYETIWEIDQYLRTSDPNDKTLAQRIEFAKASFIIIKKNPLFGIGTGNWMEAYKEAFGEMNTKLLPENRASSHNQYVNYHVKFGVIGFLWIMSAIFIPVFREGHQHNFMFVFFLIFISIANLGDSNLETHTGLSFFIFFYSLFVWNSTELIKKNIL